MNLTSLALNRTRFFLVAAIALVLAGIAVLTDYPSTEEPTVPVRTASVVAFWSGASTERQERLVAHPLEEHIREIPEVDHISTVIRPGMTFLLVDLKGNTAPAKLAAIWQRLKNKVSDAQSDLPDGVATPVVNDEYGRVTVRSLALTGDGYSAGQLQDWAKKIRERLQSVSGVEQIALYGVREERVYVDLSPDKLAAAGTSLTAVAQTLAARNLFAAPGEVDAQGHTLSIEISGNLPKVADLAAVQIALPDGTTVPLGALGKVEQRPADPPESAVLFNGKPAVVLGVAMLPGLNVGSFMSRIDERLTEIEKDIPTGMQVQTVTNQSDVVDTQIGEVGRVFMETTIIVLAVVIGFLGWRSGFVTGVIVPLTVFGTLLLMKLFGIELHQVSIAAIIISLGLFVDYAIVIIEDYQRRVGEGEPRHDAALHAGKSMAAPLFVSALAIILAFLPLVAAQNATAEYMRSLGIVVAITLMLSLFLALTLTPILSKLYAGGHGSENKTAEAVLNRVRDWYSERIRFIVRKPGIVIAGMAGLLCLAALFYSLLPQQLLSSSERAQLQIPIELAPGTSIRQTSALAARVSKSLKNPARYPEITDNAVYVGDGGPRFILALNPPVPAASRAYAIVNLRPGQDLDETVEALRQKLSDDFPEAKFEPKRFSLGPSDAGKAVFRLIGTDRAVLQAAATKLQAALEADPQMYDVNSNAEGKITAVSVVIDAAKALKAGVSHAEIAAALSSVYQGVTATTLKQGAIQVPVILRAPENDRQAPERLARLPVGGTKSVVRLGDIATIGLASQDSVLNRRDLFASIEVTARGHNLTAQDIVDRMKKHVEALALPAGSMVQYGGEISDGAEANQGIELYLPAALLGMAGLFLWQFGSVRKTIIIMASIPFVVIGATLGLWLSGQPVSFTATCGLLALAGIIVNNAVLLIERIQTETDAGKPLPQAIADAAALRLRPILMTMLTCVLGLVPLFAFGGELWKPLAASMIGGLALGTLITLALVPALYAVLFSWRKQGA